MIDVLLGKDCVNAMRRCCDTANISTSSLPHGDNATNPTERSSPTHAAGAKRDLRKSTPRTRSELSALPRKSERSRI